MALLVGLLGGVWPMGTAHAVTSPIDVSAEAIELVGQEAEQTRLLASAKRRLALARRNQARATRADDRLKAQQTVVNLEWRIQQIEMRLRLQLPARQVRELPIRQLKAYVTKVRQHIEVALQGDRLPEIDGQPLFGATDIAFTVQSNGALTGLAVQQSTPHALGLQMAQRLQQLAPFEPFPLAVAAKVGRIAFIRSFNIEPGGEVRYRLRSRPPPIRANAP